jgi:hypothetical protein
MQSLGLSDSTPRQQGWFRSLFWPSIRNDYDVDSLTRQGFWLCIIVAGLTFLMSMMVGNVAAIALDAGLYIMCGIGIRVSSRTAAVCAFLAYFLTGVVMTRMGAQGFGVVRIICLGLLLSNMRATFLAAKWVLDRTEPPPAPMSQTFMERFADVMPRRVWPIGQFVFYILAAIEFFGLLSALFLPRAAMLRTHL